MFKVDFMKYCITAQSHPRQMTSPLRYPGGKTRACKKLLQLCENNFDMENVSTVISPFFGGGSFEMFLWKKYGVAVKANDMFNPLYTFWVTCKDKQLRDHMTTMLSKQVDIVDKSVFAKYREEIMDCTDQLQTALMYFIINRCSFSGSTLSGGFSLEASKKRFTASSISRVSKLDLDSFDFSNLDFEEFMDNNNVDNSLIFLDPPYCLKRSKLYGNKGDMHTEFDHFRLFKYLDTHKDRNWIMTYNNCEYIRDLYKDFNMVETSWSYGMNVTKKSSEIVIIHRHT